MFVKKLLDKATYRPVEKLESLKAEDVNHRLVFHYGVPSLASMLAYDPIQKILAISTKNGQIKLFGKENTQALLESSDAQPSKFLQFIQNQGILLNVTLKNQIEVWNIDEKTLCHVHDFNEEITSFSVMPECSFLFIGDRTGNVTVWKFNKESPKLEKMNYWIPYSASHGSTNKDQTDHSVLYIMPQPTAESKRILIIFSDGSIILWGIQESKALFTIGGSGTGTHFPSQETKRVTSACWVCPFGSKFTVGYESGDILLCTIPSNINSGSGSPVNKNSENTQNVHTSKINLGFRVEKIPIASMKWVYSDGKANRLYVLGACDDTTSANLVQVILLNDEFESRMTKVGLQLPEPCLDMEIISSPNEQNKHKQQYLLLLGKSGLLYVYDDQSIKKCLIQSQSKSSSLPSEVLIKLPNHTSSATCAQFITSNSISVNYEDEDFKMAVKNYPSVFYFEEKNVNLLNFNGFSKIKNLYITGHGDGSVKFWDVRCPLLMPLLSLTQQHEDDVSPSGIGVTAIHYCSSRILFSGDKSGMVRIYQFKPEPFSIENGLFSLSGSSKKGNNHVIHSVKSIKVNGSVLSFNISYNSKHLAVGSEQGHISVIDIEGASILYQKKFGTELSTDIISLKFDTLNLQGFEKNVLVIATRDSSLLALDADTGNTLNNNIVRPKKPFRALFMHTLEASKGSSIEEIAQKQHLLLCSEKAVYVFSLPHLVQGVKKVFYKKKFHSSSCCWASTFNNSSSTGLILLFSCGKIEIRSLPELSLVKEDTLRSLTCLPLKPNMLPNHVISSSDDGDIIMMRSNQEVSLASVSLQNEKFRYLDSLSQVYDKNLLTLENSATSPTFHQKEKKKGMFGALFKDVTGSQTKHGVDGEALNDKAVNEELFKNFTVSNFPTQAEGSVSTDFVNDEADLDIDDIDLDDHDEKPKGNNVMALLNKQKLASKFQSVKGKLKQMTVKTEKPTENEEPQSEKGESVDQIKKKYGYSSSTPSNESSMPKIIQTKLTENVKKLQGISLKTTEMKDNAQTFSSMAKETLRLAEEKNSLSKAS